MSRVEAKDVYKYVPNLIGYSRVVTAILAFFTMPYFPILTTVLYGTSCLLDALDGTMARKYNQCSKFGAVLDMVTDRSTTSSLICTLSIMYPKWVVCFQLLLSLDITSHYMHMYATLHSGSQSHKDIDEKSSRLLHLYYTRRDVLFCICAFNELFYIGLYLMNFYHPLSSIGKFIIITCLPGFLFKQFANIIQLKRAGSILATIDAQEANEKK